MAELDDEVDFVEKRELVVERIATEENRIDKDEIDQITQPRINDEMIEVTETRKPVVNKTILEQAKQVPLANKKAETIGNKINRTTTPAKFEVKHPEKEEDEELQKSLDKNEVNSNVFYFDIYYQSRCPA